MKTFAFAYRDGRTGITCLLCGLTSWSQQDVDYRYCSNCHRFHEDQ